jgi:hypothetical protein
MQQSTSRELFAYWDRVRNGRIAPCRFDIDPARIASLLPETFIAECASLRGYPFRLAGTKICEQFGWELRGTDLLTLWTLEDRHAVAGLIRDILDNGAVGHVVFRATTRTNREAVFELVLLPLIHNGTAINLLLGAIVAIDPPFWLGAEPLERRELIDLQLHRPGTVPAFMTGGADIARVARVRLRVVEGGAGRERA